MIIRITLRQKGKIKQQNIHLNGLLRQQKTLIRMHSQQLRISVEFWIYNGIKIDLATTLKPSQLEIKILTYEIKQTKFSLNSDQRYK